MLGGVDIVAIQYKGGGPALVAALGGEIGITFPNISEAVPHVSAGRLRALGVTGARRAAALPEVPTIAESGVPGYEFSTWHGVLAPRGTPTEIVALLNAKLKAALRSPELSARFAQMGLEVIASSPEEFSAHLKREIEKWGRLIRESACAWSEGVGWRRSAARRGRAEFHYPRGALCRPSTIVSRTAAVSFSGCPRARSFPTRD